VSKRTKLPTPASERELLGLCLFSETEDCGMSVSVASADALLRGLLRWKLETATGTTYERQESVDRWVDKVVNRWGGQRERNQ